MVEGQKRNTLIATLIAALVVLPACVDLSTRYLNAAPAYFLPLFLFAMAFNGRRMMGFALMLSAVTIAGYLLGPKSPGMSWYAVIFNFRMINRLIAVGTFFLIAFLARWWVRSRASMERWGATIVWSDEDRLAYREVMGLFAARFMAIASLLIVLVLFITDLVTPADFNISIFYCLPVVMCSFLRSRALLWGEAVAVIVLTGVDHWLGMGASLEVVGQASQLHWLAINRSVAVGAILIVTLMLNFTMPTRWMLRSPLEELMDDQI